ncbi:Luminal-binding protein 1 [Hordeum vulgare]|nr:Luminal-binding protein 1 [Hordeum vulgare]
MAAAAGALRRGSRQRTARISAGTAGIGAQRARASPPARFGASLPDPRAIHLLYPIRRHPTSHDLHDGAQRDHVLPVDAPSSHEDLDAWLADNLPQILQADQFNKQLGNGDDIRQSPKAMAKLKKQVKRTKEILSANTAAPISVESLYNDIDFRSTITHEKFEELCEDLWEQALTPIKDVLAQSGMKISDIYAVELIGGATRVPKLQAKLQEFLGRSELDKHLDADEAIVLGASLHAANLSDGIKLNRKLGMIDGSTYGFVFEIDGPDYVKDESTDQVLVSRMKKMPIKLFRSIKHTKDFDVSLSYDKASELPQSQVSTLNPDHSQLNSLKGP